MADAGRLPGRYNLIIADAYEHFARQMPIGEFGERLAAGALPDKLSVVGLEKRLSETGYTHELARTMDENADDLEFQSPTIQVVLKGSFHRRGRTFDLRYDAELYPLERLFGPQLKRQTKADWITAPF